LKRFYAKTLSEDFRFIHNQRLYHAVERYTL
jgi:hypothetical protein